MSAGAEIVRFPARRAAAVWILRDAGAWLVLAGSHGWLHGSRDDADADAGWLSKNLALPVRDLA